MAVRQPNTTGVEGVPLEGTPIKPVSLKRGLRTTDYGLRTGYKTRIKV